ncbi:dehydrogenase/reductase SDR family member 7B [Denticeps clupeoides]|nr:dehydrogenase/reductase SDR family member 7B [Denticeps clupeoides]XP_028843216.1 dehydrogenase/reductase SDR family member 7B [Denticeps clupeoides]
MEGALAALTPLLLGGFGLMALCRLVQRLRLKNRVRDRVVVITGASSGLGRECARLFHQAGARLVLCGRERSSLQELAQELTESAHGELKTYTPCIVTFDLSDVDKVAMAGSEILRQCGHVDILINNAGVSYRGNIMDTHVSVQKQIMETNYFGPVALTQAILQSMVSRHSGHIVAISSIQGKISIPYRSAYSASKHAMQAYFDCLRAEVERFGLQVTVVSPGYIRTNLSINAITGDGSKYGVMDKTTATGWDPAEVARAVLTAVNHRQKEVVLAGLLPILATYIRLLCPSLFFRLMAARARKEPAVKAE